MKLLQTGCFAALSFLFACHSASTKQKQTTGIARQETNSENKLPTEEKEITGNLVYIEDSATCIEFRDLQLRVNYLAGDQDTFSIQSGNPDTVALYYAMPETILGQKLLVTGTSLNDLKVEMSYETSLTISFSGEHFDLLDWKHFTSPWKTIPVKGAAYHIPNISRKETEQFPAYTLAELKQKAIADSLPGVYTQKEGMRIVGIGRVFLRISGTGKNGKRVHVLIFEEPMGC